MTPSFLAGSAADAGFLADLLGADVGVRRGELADHALAGLCDGALRLPQPCTGASVPGVIVTAADADRLDFVLRALGAQPAPARAVVQGETLGVTAWCAPAGSPPAGGDAPAADLAADLSAILRAALPDILALHGAVPPAAIARRLAAMLVRAASRLRAQQGAAPSLRHRAAAGDIIVQARRQPYANFFSVEEYDLSFRRFDGGQSPVINRAAFVSGDAVTVLPYDPLRDRVLIVEQFRAGPFARGDAQPWSLEAIAGRIDAGETPEQAARREAVEEAGLTLGALHAVANYYASPGAKTEFLYSYVALCDLPDAAAGVFGVATEAENIRGHLLPFDDLMALVSSGEVNNAPLILTALWLQRERGRLRG